MPGRHLIAVMLLCAVLTVQAGDEVDYSAPYITVENGELVTRYPAREHQASADAAATGSGAVTQAAAEPQHQWIIVGAVIALAVAALLLVKRRRGASAAD